MRRQLIEHVGGNPTIAQSLLIQLATLKALRLALLAKIVAKQSEVSERDDRQLVCWANSLRNDLRTLGIQRPAERPPSLAEFLEIERDQTTRRAMTSARAAA